jgi:hypothetical protein
MGNIRMLDRNRGHSQQELEATMASERDGDRSDCYATVSAASAAAPRGKVWPNLVFVHDSGKGCVEFRLQCEVLLPTSVAKVLEEVFLPGGNSNLKWGEAVEMLIDHAHPGADEFFKDVLRYAIQRQPTPARAAAKVDQTQAG